MNVLLVVDFGSSNVRAQAIDASCGEIVAQHAQKYPILSPKAGFFEHDANEMWEDSVLCVRDVMKTLGKDADVRALSFSHIGASLVPMDAEFNATYNCILGMDGRAGEEAAELETRLGRLKNMPDTSFTCTELSAMAKTMFIKKRIPDIAAKTSHYASIQQYILKRLGLPMLWDETVAGSHSCYDLLTREWSQPVLEAVGIRRESLGSVICSHDVAGMLLQYGSVKFMRPVPVVIGGHDAVMGTIGLGVYDETEDAIAEVTGTVDVYCFLMNRIFNIPKERMDGVREGSMLMCEPGPLKNTTICLAGYKTAGAVIEWFLREIYGRSGSDVFADLWSRTVFDGNGSVEVGPNFVNGGGTISGLDLSVTRYDLYRACIEALTYESRALLELCSALKSVECARVRIGGGHAGSDEWVQFRADVTGRVYERMANNEVSALGAAVLAAYGVGLYPTLGDAVQRMVRVKDRFVPRRETQDRYESLYQRYVKRQA